MAIEQENEIGQENLDKGRGDFTLYDIMERGAESKYPYWVDAAPNLQTYITALNKSQPIIGCQFELVFSRWPRTLFFAKNITIPGLEVQTQDLSHAGFTIKIPTHVKYGQQEITFMVVADKEGFHYYDFRNMVLQTGHPLVAGDPKATIGNPFGINPNEDIVEVRLRNRPDDETHHHWIIHNFKPIALGDIELSQDSSNFVEFEITGTFTHISYDCGKTLPPENEEKDDQESPGFPESDEEDNDKQEDSTDSDIYPQDSTEPWFDPEDYEDFRNYWDDEEDEEEDQTPEPMMPGNGITSVSELQHKKSYPNGGAISITSSISSIIEVGKRDRDPNEPISPEEQELIHETDEKLRQAQDELNEALKNVVETVPPSDEDIDANTSNEEAYFPGEHPDFDSNEDQLGNGVFLNMTPNGDTVPIKEAGDMFGDDSCDSINASPIVMVSSTPPLTSQQKIALDDAVKQYNAKVQQIAKEHQRKKKELAQQEFENKF